MSRIGRQPVTVPAGVEVALKGNQITVKGPRGTLHRDLHPEMQITQQDGQILVSRPSDVGKHRALHGLTRSLVQNMVTGVAVGFQKQLEMVGVGYRAAKSGSKLVLTVGYSHPVEILPPPGIEFEVPSPTVIVIKGADKQLVGEISAKIRSVRPPEPYKGKGIKYVNEKIRRKVGKTGKK